MRAVLLFVLVPVACMDMGDEPWEPMAEAAPPVVFAEPDGAIATADALPTGAGAASEVAITCPDPAGPTLWPVAMISNQFQPDTLTICAGDTVSWTNEDTKEHTIYAGSPEAPEGALSSKKLYFGQSVEITFEVPGEFIYYCSTHKKKMRDARIVVL